MKNHHKKRNEAICKIAFRYRINITVPFFFTLLFR